MAFWLLFSITICVFGHSFLYGYNTGVVYSLTSLSKSFYFQIYLARAGIETVYIPESKSLHYVELPESERAAISRTTTPSPPPTTIFSEIEEDNFSEFMWSITVALFVFYGTVGAFSSGRIADYFCRKTGMIIIRLLMFVVAIFGAISSLVKSPECLMISRVFVGLHYGISVSLASLYLAEISPKKIRGAVGTCHQLFITIGILWYMMFGLSDLSGTWPLLFGFDAVHALASLLLFPLCPESPRYMLVKKNDEDGAKKGLVKLRGYLDVEDRLTEITVEARKASIVESVSLKKLLTTPELKLPIIIAVVVQVAQQWSGINADMSYSSFIFKQAEVPENTSPYVVVGQGAINDIATIVCIPPLFSLHYLYLPDLLYI